MKTLLHRMTRIRKKHHNAMVSSIKDFEDISMQQPRDSRKSSPSMKILETVRMDSEMTFYRFLHKTYLTILMG